MLRLKTSLEALSTRPLVMVSGLQAGHSTPGTSADLRQRPRDPVFDDFAIQLYHVGFLIRTKGFLMSTLNVQNLKRGLGRITTLPLTCRDTPI